MAKQRLAVFGTFYSFFSALEVSTWSGFTNSSNSAHGFTVHKLMDVVVVQVLVCS